MPLVEVLNNEIKSFEDIREISLQKVQYFKKNNLIRLHLKSKNDINSKRKEQIKSIVQKKIGCKDTNIDVICYKSVCDVTLNDVCNKYWIDIINNISFSSPICRDCLLCSTKEIKDNTIIISQGNEFINKIIINKKIDKVIKFSILDMFGLDCSIDIVYDDKLTNNTVSDNKKEEISIINNIIKENNKTSTNTRTAPPNKPDIKSEGILIGRNILDDPINLSEVNENSGLCTIIGEIFKSEIIVTKTGKKILSFFITDKTGSITVKCFTRPKNEDKLLSTIKVGLYCKIKGKVSMDTYANDIVLMPDSINILSKKERLDLYPEKRVELHLHTKMSAMDGLADTSKLIERAAKWGHKAIAITDHGVVQAFPEAMAASKKYGCKIIYGVEAYLVDDSLDLIKGHVNNEFSQSFVIFDIETTGLSILNHNIIEIGAVKIQNKEIVDRFSEFVNPEQNIPENIVELTGIDDDMVKDSDTIDIVLKRFLEFSKDSILVAHNANFDVSFIKRIGRDMNVKINNPVLDTLTLSQYLYKDISKYKLNNLCKHLGITLLNHHRAVDDAKATCDILLQSFNLLEDMDILNLDQLNDDYKKNIDIRKLQAYHLIILAKNMVGLKNLYKLISISNIDCFYKKPRMAKSLIEEHRDGLIIGSACEAGQIYKEIIYDREFDELKDVISFYDYLEIQPVLNNEFLIRKGIARDTKQLQDINKKIYDLGVKYNKKTVATCDIHFLDPTDAIYRQILMQGQGYSDADKQPPLYFRTTDEMLKEFSYFGEDVAKEVVISNTSYIADLVENIKPIPDETFPPKIDGAEDDIKKMALTKCHKIYGDVLPDIVEKRLNKELNSIINNGYAVLYLIAQKLVHKSLEDGYLVGSRGSVGSSFVATMTDITEVNGLPPHYVCPNCKYSEFITDGSIGSGADLPPKNCPNCNSELTRDGFDIPFETFLGFEGDKEPDIDLNFSGEYQSVVHKYTEEIFGKGHVFKAGTIGTIAEKTAYGYVRKYLSENNIEVNNAEIERLTLGCTGVKRTSGQHPGGVMVVPSDNEIFNFTPIQHPANDNNTDIITTHFDYHSISGRLLKLDILGHDDPTVLRMLQDLTGLDPKKIPLGDKKVLSLFTSTEALGLTPEELGCQVGTYGLPEFGTKFVRQMLLDTNPKSFSDLARISGLSHGTDVWINNAQYYIKEGYTTLKDCIATRDDIMIYLIQKGLPPKNSFTIMEKVRKGKGLTEEDEQLMKENKVPDWYIDSCKKIKYMFPKGHAVAYVMMAIRIAYFKVYYPEAYYTAYFSVRASDFDADLIVKGEESIAAKIKEISALGNDITQKDKGLLTILEICYEMYKRKIKFLKVDLYKSSATKFKIVDNGILPPMNSLTGVGDNAAINIEKARKDGEFLSKENLRKRTKVTKTVIEALNNHGCLKNLPETNQLSLF
ncbi:MAG: PolC-type DNA polymerase III [Clostridiaceae bacterium]